MKMYADDSLEQVRVHAAVSAIYRTGTDTGPYQASGVNSTRQEIPYTIQ
jgi:hypothetical protein